MSLIDRILPHRRRVLRAQFLKTLLEDVTEESRSRTQSDVQSSIDQVSANVDSLREVVEELRRSAQSEARSNMEEVKASLAEFRSVVEESRRDAQSDVRSSVGEVRSSIAELRDMVEHMRSGLSDRLAVLKEEVLTESGSLRAPFEEFYERSAAQLAHVVDLAERVTTLKGDVVAQISFFLRDIEILLSSAVGRLTAAGDSVKEAAQTNASQRSLDEVVASLAKIDVEHSNKLTHLDTALHSRLNFLQNELLPALVEQVHQGSTAQTDASRRGLDEAVALLTKIDVEHSNMLTHLDTSLHSRLNTLQNEVLPALIEQVHQLSAAQLSEEAKQADRLRWTVQPAERYRAAQSKPLEATLRRAEKDFPEVFSAWRERLDLTNEAFKQTKVGNAANRADLYSRMFTDFLASHVQGRVLDVGCGPFGRPVYLADYPAELVSGLEPLPMMEPADFECVPGISEYLPWPDASFSTVVSATSLDHCLSLDRSLEEMQRVLVPDGAAIFWIGSNPGTKLYAPESPDFVPADKFHLFHFDWVWFEPLLERSFEIVRRMEFPKQSFSHVFYALRRRN